MDFMWQCHMIGLGSIFVILGYGGGNENNKNKCNGFLLLLLFLFLSFYYKNYEYNWKHLEFFVSVKRKSGVHCDKVCDTFIWLMI